VTGEPRRATQAELDDVVRVFADAFASDPMITWPLPPGAPRGAIESLFSIVIHDAYGPMDVVWVVGEDRVDGAAVWLPPDQVARFDEVEAATRPRIANLTDDGGARYARFWDWLGGHLPAEPNWFLDILAVRHEARGRGHASALVRHGLGVAHAAGLSAFLETGNPANLPMYEHLGFGVVEQSDAPDGGPTIWFLRADPRRAI
jgi:GNAT superfamily N-acetyltransferase